MLRYVLFDLSLFSGADGKAHLDEEGLLWLLEALTQWNQIYLKRHPSTPSIYKSGIRYKLPEQIERADLPQIEVVRGALSRAGVADPNTHEALEDLAQMCGGGEHFRDIPRVIENGGGDCDNLSSWRCAELRQMGIRAMPYITKKQREDGGTTYHAIVRWPDGGSEDPSLLLGMGGEDRAKDRAEEVRKLKERTGKAKSALRLAKALGMNVKRRGVA